MSLLTAFAVGACIGIWLDIALDRWGADLSAVLQRLLDTFVGQALVAALDLMRWWLLGAWELVRFDLPDLIRARRRG